MSKIGLHSMVTRNNSIVVGIIDEEIVMMNLETREHYHLNSSGKQIWDLLDQPQTVDELCRALGSRYEVTSEACEKDILRFVEELAAQGIVLVG